MTDAVQMGSRENGLVIITGGSGRLWKAIGCYSYPRARGMWFSLNWEQWGWGDMSRSERVHTVIRTALKRMR